MMVKRWNPGPQWEGEDDPEGPWVDYDDYKALESKLQERIDELEGKLDGAIDAWREMMTDGNSEEVQQAAKWKLLAALESRVAAKHAHTLVDPSNEVVEAGGWRLCVECGYLQKPQDE